ncbi:MAG: hypothetical protein ACSLE6_09950 [Mycobacterium sp.]
MRTTDTIDILGYNGDRCRVSGPGMGDWGPELARHSTGLFGMPFKSNWGKGAFGQNFASWSHVRRDVAATFHIMTPRGEPAISADPDLWHLIYSRFSAMFHPEYESTVVYGSVDGERRLGVRLAEGVRPFVGAEFEGGDPHLMSYGSIGMLLACELPFYVGADERYVWETDYQGDFWFRLPYYNPASVICYPKWYLTDRARWILPDYSFGWEEYGSGIADLGKTVELPLLIEGENIEVDSRPDVETIIADNENPVYERMVGRDLEYPIQPGMGDPYEGCVVRVLDVTNPDGARCELDLPRWYAEPFSTPTVVGTSVGIGAA